MSKTIWKFPLTLDGVQTIEMPACPEFLTVQSQDIPNLARRAQHVLWAVVDPSMPRVPVEIAIYGTGVDIPDNPGRYIATVQTGPYVWHYFARNHV